MKIKTYITSCILVLLLFPLSANAAVSPSFEIIRFKGSVEFQSLNHKSFIKVTKRRSLTNNTFIRTGSKSMVRIKNLKRGIITLGPNSEMVLDKGEAHSPGLIELLRGKARIKVNEYERKDKGHKLLIKTKTASIGVRGTEFILTHNDINNITSAISFKGKVEIKKTPDRIILEESKESQHSENKVKDRLNKNVSIEGLEQSLENYNNKEIKSGSFTSAFPGKREILPPTKISKKQFHTLKRNSHFHKESEKINTINKKKNKKLSLLDSNLIPSPSENKESSEKTSNSKDYHSVRPGGILDLQTGIYIEPPSHAKYNSKDKVYELPKDHGDIDKNTGEYRAPHGLELHPVKGYIISKMHLLSKNIESLKKMQDRMNKKVTVALKDFKNISKLEMNAEGSYKYGSNIYENYFDEKRKPSNIESSYWQMSGTLFHDTLISRNYSLRPFIHSSLTYHNRRTTPELKKYDKVLAEGGLSLEIKHQAFKNNAYFIFRPSWKNLYQDSFAKNQWDFYAEAYGFKLSEKFSLHKKHTTEVGYQFYRLEGTHKSQRGILQKIIFNHLMDWGKSHNSYIKFDFTQRQDEIVTQVYRGEFEIERFNIARKLNAFININLGRTLSRAKSEWDYGTGLKLIRKKGEFLTFSAAYDYLNKKSKGSSNFDSNIFSIGLDFNL